MMSPEHSRRRLSPEQREALRRQRSESRATTTYKDFLKDLRNKGYASDALAERAVEAVLCALEYRLTSDQSWKLESQLPSKLRQHLTRCELHEELLPRAIHRAEFLELIAQCMRGTQAEALQAAISVFETIAEHVTAGEVLKVIHQLPPDLRALWPAWARAAEEYREIVRRAGPPESPPSDVARGGTELVDELLQLPLGAQVAVLRAVAPWVLARLDLEEQEELIGELQRETLEVARALNPPKPPTLAS
jgi:uncharacterized protein (DUF2267 family)